MKKYLIINADDFGMSHEFNIAISELLVNHCISTTSLMANGLAYKEALELIDNKSLKNIGVHLTLTKDAFDVEEPLVYDCLTGRESLRNIKGELYSNAELLKNNVKYVDLIDEMAVQMKKIINDGVEFTHIDNHMYSIIPRGGWIGAKALFEAYHSLNRGRPCGIRIAKKYYNFDGMNYIWGGRKIAPFLRYNMNRLKLYGPDYSFAFPYYADRFPTLNAKRELLKKFLNSLKEGVTELHIHPCIESEALKKYNPYWENRVQEYELFNEFNKYKLEQDFNVCLISYLELGKIFEK